MILLKGIFGPLPLLFSQSFAVALPTEEYSLDKASELPSQSRDVKEIFQPKVASRFQIVLNRGDYGRRTSSSLLNTDAEVLDLDLFDTSAQTIRQLHSQGKKVICYFSAGSSESWRKDNSKFQATDKGDTLRGWNRENWLDLRSPNVWSVMQSRIKLAAEKNCDGIDPDNIDSFGDEVRPGGGFNPPITRQDTVDYIKKLSAEAHSHGLAMGLKNAETILPHVSRDVEFAVNEQCATYFGGCSAYSSFLASGKPVFHIEYATPTRETNGSQGAIKADLESLNGMPSEKLQKVYCLEENLQGIRSRMSADIRKKFSTVIKEMDLGPWVLYCDSVIPSGDGKAPAEALAPELPIGLSDLMKPKGLKQPEPVVSQDQASTQAWSGWLELLKPKTQKGMPNSNPKDSKQEGPTDEKWEDRPRIPKGWSDFFTSKPSKPESPAQSQTTALPTLPTGWEAFFAPKSPKSEQPEDFPRSFSKGWSDFFKSRGWEGSQDRE